MEGSMCGSLLSEDDIWRYEMGTDNEHKGAIVVVQGISAYYLGDFHFIF